MKDINKNEKVNNYNNIISKDIICRECKEKTLIKISNYKISMSNCKNGHNISDIKINEFENTQIIDISKIVCDECKEKNKGEAKNNEFYKCITCNINLCTLCKTKHDNNHKIIDHNNINYICNIHNETFTRYCNDCKINICMVCEKEHKGHKGVSLGEIISSDNNYLNELKESIDKLKIELKEIIKKLESIIQNMESYYKISNNAINNAKRNYESLKNKNEFINFNNLIVNDINKIINDNNLNTKINNLMNIYNKMICNINYIIGEINITPKDINKDIRIINSYEECKRVYKWKNSENENKYEN